VIDAMKATDPRERLQRGDGRIERGRALWGAAHDVLDLETCMIVAQSRRKISIHYPKFAARASPRISRSHVLF
jgi:hypothetical protein